MSEWARWAVCAAGAFLAGSVPFGLLIARARGVDIREHGSKNIGATNVMRVLGRPLGALCLVLDALKGALPVLLAGAWAGALGVRALPLAAAWAWMGVAAAAILGHMFSPWVRFKGGKGVATGLGACLALWPAVGAAACAAVVVWVIVVRATRYVGVASCAAAAALPLAVAAAHAAGLAGDSPHPASRLAQGAPFILATAALAATVVWKHRGNIARTLGGTEHRIGERVRPR